MEFLAWKLSESDRTTLTPFLSRQWEWERPARLGLGARADAGDADGRVVPEPEPSHNRAVADGGGRARAGAGRQSLVAQLARDRAVPAVRGPGAGPPRAGADAAGRGGDVDRR